MKKPKPSAVHTTAFENIAKEFSVRGMVLLSPKQLAIDTAVHHGIRQDMLKAKANKAPTGPNDIVGIKEVLNAPGLNKALETLIGDDWAVVPFTHNSPFCSGAYDQMWHKDDNNPYNGRRMRHHHLVQLEMIYYPQDVTYTMGPTATIPYAHYWTFNHEENNDNFAGADHLDFTYQLTGREGVPVSGPQSNYDPHDIANGTTAHDELMHDAVANTQWPYAKQLELCPVKAGSVLLYSHNTWHRGNHRRDHWDEWEKNPRFMWRFYLYRTTEPKTIVEAPPINWKSLGTDALTQTDLTDASDDLCHTWDHHYQWLHGQESSVHCTTAVADLRKALFTKYDEGEPDRIGAAYAIAALEDKQVALALLKDGLYSERENVRRASMYGFIAMGDASTGILMEASTSACKYLRKAGLFGLGEAAAPSQATLDRLTHALHSDCSVYNRSVAATALGCLARRAFGDSSHDHTVLTSQIINALGTSLSQEVNRTAMDIVQKRGIKMVRPTDDSDVCEGNGIDFGMERFNRVRSAVRENTLWSLVVISTHAHRLTPDALIALTNTLQAVLENDDNLISYGYAQDALHRLCKGEAPTELDWETIESNMPIPCREALVVYKPDCLQHV